MQFITVYLLLIYFLLTINGNKNSNDFFEWKISNTSYLPRADERMLVGYDNDKKLIWLLGILIHIKYIFICISSNIKQY